MVEKVPSPDVWTIFHNSEQSALIGHSATLTATFAGNPVPLTVTRCPSLNGAAGETEIDTLLGGGAGPGLKTTGSMFPVPSFAKTLYGSTTAIEQPCGYVAQSI